MSNIQYGCQTYTWQMNIGKYQGQFEHFLKVLSMAGYTGIEAEVCMLGDFYHDWQRTKDLLDQYNVRFTALAFHLPWLNEKETEEEFAAANKAIEFLSHFPTAKLMLAHAAADPVREHNLREKQRNQLNCLTSIGQRAMECGVVPVFHPNSAPNSIFRYAQDYEIMFEALYKSPVG